MRRKNMGLRYGFASKMSGSKWWWFESWSTKWRCRMAISCRWAIVRIQRWHLYVVGGFVYVEETKCWIYFGEKSSSNEGGTGDEWLVDKMAAKRENSSPKVTGEGNWNGSDILYFLATKRRHGESDNGYGMTSYLGHFCHPDKRGDNRLRVKIILHRGRSDIRMGDPVRVLLFENVCSNF